MMADPESIEAAVKGTPLAALLDPGAPAQRAGVLSSLNMVADSLELLPEWEHTRPTFATAEWYTERKRWVFLTSSAAYRQKVLPLHSAWLDLFILRMMGYCEDQAAKPVWFVLDELASLNKLPQLHTAVTENRKYGNPVVLGLAGAQPDGKALRPGRRSHALPACDEDIPQDFRAACGEMDLRGHRRNRGRASERVPQHGAAGLEEELCDGDRHQAARHGLRDRRPASAHRFYQTGESCCTGKVPAGEETEQAAGVLRTDERKAPAAQSGCREDFGSRESTRDKEACSSSFADRGDALVKREGFSWDESKGIE